MVLVIDKSKKEKEEMYKLYYSEGDIDSINPDLEIIKLEPINKYNNDKPVEKFQSIYGC